MKRITGLFFVALMAVVPAAANAQKPADASETRSADVYFKNAEESTLNAEKKEFYQKALDIARVATAKYPNNPKPWFQIGKAQYELGNYMAADSALSKAESMYPDYKKETADMRERMWVAVFNDAVKEIRANDPAKGLETLRLAQRINPSRFETLQTMGSIYMQTGDLKGAEQSYKDELVVLRGPGRKGLDAKKEAMWAEAELNAVKALATMYGQLNRYAEAETLYRELLARDPQNPAVMSNLALMMNRGGKKDEAAAMYTQLLQRTDLTGNQLLNVGIAMYNAQQYEKAADAFDRASKLNPYNYDILDFQVNAIAGILEGHQKMLEGKPAAEVKAMAPMMMAQYEKIIAAATRALDLSPSDATMVMRLAAAQRGMSDNDTPKAAEWRNKVLATLTRNQALKYSLSEIQSIAEEKTITLAGTITGLQDNPKGTAKLKFHLLDKDGKSVASKDIEVVIPKKDDRAPFEVTIDSPATAVAWKYEVIS